MNQNSRKRSPLAEPSARRSLHRTREFEIRQAHVRGFPPPPTSPPSTTQLAQSSVNEGAIELVALAMRCEGLPYSEIFQTLNIGADIARRFVENAARH